MNDRRCGMPYDAHGNEDPKGIYHLKPTASDRRGASGIFIISSNTYLFILLAIGAFMFFGWLF